MPDLVILDLGLPDVDGIEVLGGCAERTRAPVIVLSARSDRYDKIRALDAGADDYVTKPFDFEELVARIRSALRRATPAPEATTLRCRDFIIDMARKEVRLADGTDVRLTPTEWAFLEVLASSPAWRWAAPICCAPRGDPATSATPTTCGSTRRSCARSSSRTRPTRDTSSPSGRRVSARSHRLVAFLRRSSGLLRGDHSERHRCYHDQDYGADEEGLVKPAIWALVRSSGNSARW